MCKINKLNKGGDIVGKKISKEYVISYLDSFGYKLMSDYKNISSIITIMCSEGHVYYVKFNNFKTGYRLSLIHI